jgi:hypothetical protein
MVRAGAGFENHLRRRQFDKKRLDLSTPDLTTQHRPLLLIDPVDRKNMLRRIDRNALKFHRAALSLGWSFDPILAHRCRWAVHPNTTVVLDSVDIHGSGAAADVIQTPFREEF